MNTKLARNITIEAFIMAGGQSTRMGADKGLIPLRGKAMVSYIIDTLQKSGLPTKLIANNPAYHNFGLPVYSDVVVKKGPLGGLLTAVENTTADLILLVACDMPLISIETITYLISAADCEHLVVSVIEGKLNPLFSLYPRNLKAQIEKCISANQLKMVDFISNTKNSVYRAFPAHMNGRFQNINDKATLVDLEANWDNNMP